MMKLFVIAYLVASTLPHGTFAGGELLCSNFSLPNFLDLGECLEASGDLCTADSDGIVLFLDQLLQCTFQGLGTVDLGSQIYILQELLKYLLERNDFDIILPLLTDVCSRLNSIVAFLSAGVIKLSCDELHFDNSAVCGEPIVIIVEATSPFASCLNVTGLTCAGNTPVDEPAIVGFVRVLAGFYGVIYYKNIKRRKRLCLLNYVFTTAPSEVVTQVGCDLIAGITGLLGSASSTLVQPLTCALQSAIGSSCTAASC